MTVTKDQIDKMMTMVASARQAEAHWLGAKERARQMLAAAQWSDDEPDAEMMDDAKSAHRLFCDAFTIAKHRVYNVAMEMGYGVKREITTMDRLENTAMGLYTKFNSLWFGNVKPTDKRMRNLVKQH